MSDLFYNFIDIEITPNGSYRHFQVVHAATGKVSHLHTAGPQAILLRIPAGYAAIEVDLD